MRLRTGFSTIFENYSEFDRFEALERGEPVGPMPVGDEQIWRENLALNDLAEPLGFDSLWTLEHRSSPYIMLPSPMQLLAYFAGRTKRINLGTFVTVLPWHDPVRLAEEVSCLQHLLGPERTLMLGVGRGLARREYEAMSMLKEEARDRFREIIDVLRLAHRNERFSYEGTYYKYHNIQVRPRPLDSSIVDDMYGAWGSPPSIPIMAELGVNPLATFVRLLYDTQKEMAKYQAIRRKRGYPPAKKPITQSFLYCAESEQEAYEGTVRYLTEYAEASVRHYEYNIKPKDIKGYEFYTSKIETTTVQAAAAAFADIFIKDSVWGTPAQCVEKMAVINEALGPSEIILEINNGSMTADVAERSIRLFAEKALPEINKMTSKDISYETDDVDVELAEATPSP